MLPGCSAGQERSRQSSTATPGEVSGLAARPRESLPQSFFCELVIWIEIESRSKLGGSPNACVLEQEGVSALNMGEHQPGFQNFPSGQEVDILGSKTRGVIELGKCFFCVLVIA